MMTSSVQGLRPREVKIRVHDRVEIAVALYMPAGDGPFPVLFAPSPYRYDNNSLPASPQFLWRETGPIEFYVGQGYVYANMDVRGCGKSGGDRIVTKWLSTARHPRFNRPYTDLV
jgi:uncharacterized protein